MAAPLSGVATTVSGPRYLAIDVGTGSVRAALVDGDGRIERIESREHEQIVPRYGWSEQRPADWWDGVVAVVRRLVDGAPDEARRIEAICTCGQMHGTVLIDDDGLPTRPTVPLWNDKRTAALVDAFEARHATRDILADCANPPTPAWPGFKLQWLRDHDADAYRRASAVLMPKDYVNLRFTGERAMDPTEASCSFLMDPRTGDWSDAMIARLDLERGKLPPIRRPGDILGTLTDEAARSTGLARGLPVLVGGGDYPMALLGSGAATPGLGSDVTGTSAIVTAILAEPVLDPEIDPEICNVAIPGGAWGAFVLLDSGGDAVRWARRALHGNAVGYDEVTRRAAEAPPGSDNLFFLPYLVGERFGRQRNSRAQFFGITPAHGLPHLHRAVLEGVAFSVARHKDIMERAAGRRMERIVASGGGARNRLWLLIKASVYGVPVLVPEEAECGVVGCAMLAAAATGRADASARFVRVADEIGPNPAWTERYARMLPVFDSLYRNSQSQYALLDELAS